jgi:hypothetical protein
MTVKSVGERKPSYFSSPNFFVRFLLPSKPPVYIWKKTVLYFMYFTLTQTTVDRWSFVIGSPRSLSLARLTPPDLSNQHTFDLSIMVNYCTCGCGLRVNRSGDYRGPCLPAGKKNRTRKPNTGRKEKAFAVRNASAVEDIGFPALTETLRLVSTSQAILRFRERPVVRSDCGW